MISLFSSHLNLPIQFIEIIYIESANQRTSVKAVIEANSLSF